MHHLTCCLARRHPCSLPMDARSCARWCATPNTRRRSAGELGGTAACSLLASLWCGGWVWQLSWLDHRHTQAVPACTCLARLHKALYRRMPANNAACPGPLPCPRRTFAQSGTCPYGTRCRFIHTTTGSTPPSPSAAVHTGSTGPCTGTGIQTHTPALSRVRHGGHQPVQGATRSPGGHAFSVRRGSSDLPSTVSSLALPPPLVQALSLSAAPS